MAKGLYIGATSPYSGKTMLTIGIGQHLQKEGLSIGYCKPVSTTPSEVDNTLCDNDAIFVQEVLGLSTPIAEVTPVLVTQDMKMRALTGHEEDHFPAISTAYSAISKRHDLTLVGGSGHMFSDKYCNLDGIRLAHELDLKAIIIDRVTSAVNYDILLTYKEHLGDKLLGTVLNNIPPSFMTEINTVTRPFLEKKGIPVLGVIPSDPLISSIKAQEIADSLGGRLVTAQGRANGMVESFLIGTMQVENFMTYFRRHANAAIIVGGDRADVQLVAIEGNCPCLILTGNLFPNDIILSRAETLGVPIIMVREDSFSVAQKMEILLSRHKLRDIIKVRQAAQLVSSALDFPQIKNSLGMK